MVSELGSLICNEFSGERHVIHRVHVQVLIIGEDHDNVGSSFGGAYAVLYLRRR
jgi:hypothetical protein